MNEEQAFRLSADAVLALHVLLVSFVVGGLVFVVIGNLKRWRWVNALSFRVAHLATIAVVVAESWLDLTCPLTSLEMWLRGRAHEAAYSESFTAHWLRQILYYDAPPWVFAVAYTVFALVVVASWVWFPPTSTRRSKYFGNHQDAKRAWK